MFRQEKYEIRRGVLLLFLIVMVSGLLLSITGNAQGPFDALSNIANAINPENAGDIKGPPPPPNEASQGNGGKGQYETSNADQPPKGKDSGGQYKGPEDGWSFATPLWKLFGPFLFNLWFFASVISVILLLGTLLKKPQKKGLITDGPHD